MKLNNLRILVAEDHERMRDCIVRVLRSEFDVIGAVRDGHELVDAAIALQPDVIVSDICMPVLGGLEAQEHLRAQGIDIPFVFVSIDPILKDGTKGLGTCVAKTDLVSDLNAEVRSAAKHERGIHSDNILCSAVSC